MRNVDIEKAVLLYYERLTLSCEDIRQIFGVTSKSTVSRLKKQVINYWAERGKNPVFRPARIITTDAYEAWGLDIANLEHRLNKLRKLRQ